MTIEPKFRTSMPPPAPDSWGGVRVLRTLRRNALAAFPRRCLDEAVVRLSAHAFALFLVADGKVMQEILQVRAADFVRVKVARRVLGPIAGDGLLVSSGERWRKQRAAMAPAFTPRALPMMAAHIVRIAESACLRFEHRGEAPQDLLRAMQLISLDIAACSMFSIETAGFRDEVRAMIAAFTSGLGRPSLEDFFLPGFVPTPLMLRRRAFRAQWRRLIDLVVAQRRAGSSTNARDLFDLLAAAHGADSDAMLRDEVATMLVAGHETTALTLFWALYLLAHAPGWQRSVCAEAAAADLSPEGAADALPALPATRAVVQETLRLYAPAFMTARIAARATSAGGREVPRGSLVLLPFWLLHRNPAAWPDPDAFDPQRFLDDPMPDRSQFMPFGSGPHSCIGAQLAMAEAVLVLALFFRRWRIALGEPSRAVLPVATLSTRPDHAPAFRLFPAAHEHAMSSFRVSPAAS